MSETKTPPKTTSALDLLPARGDRGSARGAVARKPRRPRRSGRSRGAVEAHRRVRFRPKAAMVCSRNRGSRSASRATSRRRGKGLRLPRRSRRGMARSRRRRAGHERVLSAHGCEPRGRRRGRRPSALRFPPLGIRSATERARKPRSAMPRRRTRVCSCSLRSSVGESSGRSTAKHRCSMYRVFRSPPKRCSSRRSNCRC